ncbi:MAG: CPBP family glutamic-type intramembrane protease [Akkermansiaceae bacterium]
MESSPYKTPNSKSPPTEPDPAPEHSKLTLPQVDAKVWIALTYTALIMTLLTYYGKTNHSIQYFKDFFYSFGTVEKITFAAKLYWVVFGVTIYFIIPWIIIRCRKEKLRDYGLRLPTSYSHLWIYGVMLVIVIILAYFASFQQSFQNKYPYYKYFQEAPDLYALFWVGRAFRFFALEFFFRGYLLFSLRPKMGDSAFFVSMVPYCMLHFGKPFPETIFAIIGGIIFCWIAARTKSIWGAVVLHVALAMAMDFFSIAQKLNWIG